MREQRDRWSKWAACLLLIVGLMMGHWGCGDPPQTTITFRPMVGDKPFACGQTYAGLGTSKASFLPYDFRMLVHNVRLVSSAGEEVPLQLASDGKWQSDQVALLDFEDATGECEKTGTQETRLTIVGDVPGGTYKGLHFTLGVPFALNHANAFEAAAPLNTTAMFWSWALGYKFFRIDGKVPQNDNKFYRFHVGSMGCELASGDPNKVTSCSLPNRAEIKLADFEVGKHAVVVDVAKVLAGATLDKEVAGFGAGCQAEPKNTQCAPLFQSLGMTFEEATLAPDKQTAFSIAPLE